MNECILVADDDREIVKAIAILLEKEGYRESIRRDAGAGCAHAAQRTARDHGCDDAEHGRIICGDAYSGNQKSSDYRFECEK